MQTPQTPHHMERMRVDPLRALDATAETYPLADRCEFRARMLAALAHRVDADAWAASLAAAQDGMNAAAGANHA